MSDNFKTGIKIELSPRITIGDISGNVGLGSLAMILMAFMMVIFIIVFAILFTGKSQ